MVRSPLTRRVTAVVFVAILAVEAVMLLSSYLRREGELLADLRHSGTQWASAISRNLGADAPSESVAAAILDSDQVTGVVVVSGNGKVANVGEPLTGPMQAGAGYRTPDGSRYEVLLTPKDVASGDTVALRLDSSHVAGELHAFILRAVGMLLLITVVLTVATTSAIGSVVLRPLARLTRALDNSDLTTNPQTDPDAARRDEIGDVYRATAIMLGQLKSAQHILEAAVVERTTELKEANARLRAGERRFRDFAEASADFYWEMDRTLHFSYFSERFAAVAGVPAQDLLGRRPLDLPPPDMDPRIWEGHLRDLTERRPFRNFVQPRTGTDGVCRYLSISGQPVFDPDGSFTGYRGTGADVTAEIEVQQEVARQKALLELTLANMEQGVSVYDKDLNLIAWNEAYARLRALPTDFLCTYPSLREIFTYQARRGAFPHLDGTVEEQVDRLMEIATKQEFQRPTEHIRPDGSIQEARSHRLPDGGILRTFTDVTERKRTEDSQRAILDAIAIPLFVVSDEDTYYYVNPQAAELIGRRGEDLTGQPSVGLYTDETDRRRFLDLIRTDGKVDGFEARINLPDGRTGWALVSARVLTFRGKPARLSAVTVITDRKKAEEGLRESEARLRAITDNVPMLLNLKDADGVYQFVNTHYSHWLNRPIEEIVGKSVYDMLPKERAEMLSAEDAKVLASGETSVFEAHSAVSHTEGHRMHFIKFPVRDGEGRITGLGTAVLDVTERFRAEAELAEKERHLSTALGNMSQGIALVDRDLNYVFFNDHYLQFLDLKDATLQVGDSFVTIAHELARRGAYGPGDPQDLARERLEELRNDQFVERELNTRTGEVVQARKTPVAGGGAVLTLTDITSRKKAERAVARNADLLRLSMENMTDGIYVLDGKMNYLMFNDRYLELAELSRADVAVGMPVRDVVTRMAERGFYGPGDRDALIENRMRNFQSGLYDEREVTTPTGRVLHVRRSPLEDGGSVVTLTDITQRKRVEDAIVMAKETADAASRAKSDLVAMVSHEVRTPMNGVLGMARLMRETPLDQDQRESLETVIASAESLLRIVDDLLDISKLEAGRLELEELPFLAVDVIEQCAAVMSVKADEKGLDLIQKVDPGVPPVVIGDPHRLRQVMMNLLSNAIKFTRAGAVIVELKRVTRKRKTADLEFSVTDTGQGIRPENQAKLFSPFTQGAIEVARKYGGTGLGLAICRRLVGLMGGEIKLDSEWGKGSRFHFTLSLPVDTETDPVALRERSNVRANGTGNETRGPALRILQVEDNDTNRQVVEKLMRRSGHRVTSVANGQEALAILASEHFDLIIMDRHMPVMSGDAATQAIRAMGGAFATMPIVGVTAGAQEDEIDACLSAGMDTVLTKPIDGNELRQTVLRLARPTVSLPAVLTGKPVLVVDDVQVNLAVARKQLARLNVSCDVTDRPEQALEQLKSGDYALAIVDIDMPILSGLDLTRELRDWEATAGGHLPVIAMTGYLSPEDRARFLAGGMDDCLGKPMVLEDLAAVLGRWLGAGNEVPPTGPETRAPEAKPNGGAPVDLAGLARILGMDDPAVLFEMLDLFVMSFPELLDPLDAALAGSDATSVRRAAHAAKSAAANAAAGSLTRTLQRLESEAAAEDWDGLAALVADVHLEYDRITAFCTRHREGA